MALKSRANGTIWPGIELSPVPFGPRVPKIHAYMPPKGKPLGLEECSVSSGADPGKDQVDTPPYPGVCVDDSEASPFLVYEAINLAVRMHAWCSCMRACMEAMPQWVQDPTTPHRVQITYNACPCTRMGGGTPGHAPCMHACMHPLCMPKGNRVHGQKATPPHDIHQHGHVGDIMGHR
jgi:hypothetical protein